MHTSHVSIYSWARLVGLQENLRQLAQDHMSGHLGLGHVSIYSWARLVGIQENLRQLAQDHMSGHLGLGEVELVTRSTGENWVTMF